MSLFSSFFFALGDGSGLWRILFRSSPRLTAHAVLLRGKKKRKREIKVALISPLLRFLPACLLACLHVARHNAGYIFVCNLYKTHFFILCRACRNRQCVRLLINIGM